MMIPGFLTHFGFGARSSAQDLYGFYARVEAATARSHRLSTRLTLVRTNTVSLELCRALGPGPLHDGSESGPGEFAPFDRDGHRQLPGRFFGRRFETGRKICYLILMEVASPALRGEKRPLPIPVLLFARKRHGFGSNRGDLYFVIFFAAAL